MKFKLGLFLSLVFISLTAISAVRLKVPKVKFNNGFRHTLVAQTKPELIQKYSNVTVLRKYYINKWGTERFEYGYANFLCRGARCEQAEEPVALRYYKQCKGFKSNGQPNCGKVESYRVDIQDPTAGHGANSRRTWYSCEDYGSPCRDYDELNEYPARYTNEDEFGLNF